jgi:uroporphyrinogen-III decarboxylase
MQPIERIFKAARFEPVDHVPVAGAITDFYLAEITPGLEGLAEPERQLKMTARAAELFPEIPIIFTLDPTPAIYPELIRRLREAAGDGPPRAEHLKEITIPDPTADNVNLERLKEIKYYIENVPDEWKRKYGYCDGVLRFENPFDTLVSVVGSTEWFMRIRSDPGFVEAAMELFTEASIVGARWLAERIGQPKFVILAEDFPGYINRASFERFVVPYHKRIFETFPNALKLLHNDSNTSHLLEALPGCGMDMFHFGYEVDVAAAKAAMGGRVALMGNLSPMSVLARGTDEEVVRCCEEILRAGAPGGGFIFATGGEVNPGTPPVRVNLMLELARKFGSE